MSIIVGHISQKFAILSILQTADQKQTYIYCQRRFWWDSQTEIIVRINFGSEISGNAVSCAQSREDKVLSAILSWYSR